MYKKMFFQNRGSNMFKKASPVFNRVFNQGREFVSQSSRAIGNVGGYIDKGRDIANNQGREFVSQTSKALGNVGRYLDKGSEIGSKIANNSALTSLQSPNLQRGLSLLAKASDTAKRASSLAHNADKFTNEGSYKGNHEENLTNAVERAKSLKQEASNIFI